MNFNDEHLFENFVAFEHNIAEVNSAIDFARDQRNRLPLVICSAGGNGATHLARAVLHQIQQEQNLSAEQVFYGSYESLMNKVRSLSSFELPFLPTVEALLIDSYYNWGENKGALPIHFPQHNLQKVIITCGLETPIPIPHQRIQLVCPSLEEQKVIIANYSQKYQEIPQTVIQFLAECGISNVNALYGMLNALYAESIRLNRKIDLETAKITFENFKSFL